MSDRPMCCAKDARAIGYDLIPCCNVGIALFRMEGVPDDEVLCLECLGRRIRIAIDLHGYVLTVMAAPMPAPAPAEPAELPGAAPASETPAP